jgi:hypothetical protein
MWSIAAQGLGWTFGWQSHREEPPPGLVAIPIEDFSMNWGGELVYRQDEARVPVLATVDSILAHAKELYPRIDPDDAQLPSAHTSDAVVS